MSERSQTINVSSYTYDTGVIYDKVGPPIQREDNTLCAKIGPPGKVPLVRTALWDVGSAPIVGHAVITRSESFSFSHLVLVTISRASWHRFTRAVASGPNGVETRMIACEAHKADENAFTTSYNWLRKCCILELDDIPMEPWMRLSISTHSPLRLMMPNVTAELMDDIKQAFLTGNVHWVDFRKREDELVGDGRKCQDASA
ncbi:hypothetical protein V8B97DRAFT_1917286 [Scleroderma yunnanense]